MIDGWSTWDLSPTQTLLNSFPGRRHRTGHMEKVEMYHCCEIFCGCSAVSRAMEEKGYRAFRFDVRRDESQNIHTVEGIELVAHAMVKTYPVKGLAVFEPTCGSWIFISLGCTLRQIESCINLTTKRNTVFKFIFKYFYFIYIILFGAWAKTWRISHIFHSWLVFVLFQLRRFTAIPPCRVLFAATARDPSWGAFCSHWPNGCFCHGCASNQSSPQITKNANKIFSIVITDWMYTKQISLKLTAQRCVSVSDSFYLSH